MIVISLIDPSHGLVYAVQLTSEELFRLLLDLKLQRVQPADMCSCRSIFQLLFPDRCDRILLPLSDVLFNIPLKFLPLCFAQELPGLLHRDPIVCSKALIPHRNLPLKLPLYLLILMGDLLIPRSCLPVSKLFELRETLLPILTRLHAPRLRVRSSGDTPLPKETPPLPSDGPFLHSRPSRRDDERGASPSR